MNPRRNADNNVIKHTGNARNQRFMTQSNRVKSAGKDGVTHVNRREKIRQRTAPTKLCFSVFQPDGSGMSMPPSAYIRPPTALRPPAAFNNRRHASGAPYSAKGGSKKIMSNRL